MAVRLPRDLPGHFPTPKSTTEKKQFSSTWCLALTEDGWSLPSAAGHALLADQPVLEGDDKVRLQRQGECYELSESNSRTGWKHTWQEQRGQQRSRCHLNGTQCKRSHAQKTGTVPPLLSSLPASGKAGGTMVMHQGAARDHPALRPRVSVMGSTTTCSLLTFMQSLCPFNLIWDLINITNMFSCRKKKILICKNSEHSFSETTYHGN